MKAPLLASQVVVRICLFLFAAIALFGGALQMYLGQPETAPRLDNVHRFMAGIHFGCGLICLWAAITVCRQRTLVLLNPTPLRPSGVDSRLCAHG